MGWIGYVPSHFTKGGNINKRQNATRILWKGQIKVILCSQISHERQRILRRHQKYGSL